VSERWEGAICLDKQLIEHKFPSPKRIEENYSTHQRESKRITQHITENRRELLNTLKRIEKNYSTHQRESKKITEQVVFANLILTLMK
jgi:hypothetical protein